MFKKFSIIIVLTLLMSGNAYSGGFQINEHGAKAMAMAGAFVGLADDASAAYFNPAGITQLEGTHIMAGTTFILPSSSFTSDGWGGNVTTDMEDALYYPINFYLTHQLNESLFVGLSVNNPYGLGTTWAGDWVGRYVAFESDMRTFFINPVIAYKVSDKLSISVGGVFVYGDVTLSSKTLLGVNPATGATIDATTTLEGDGTAFGFTAGVLFTPSDDLQWGISYKSETSIEFEGTAATDPAMIQVEHPLYGMLDYPLPNGAIVAKFTTPWVVQVGFAYKATEKFTISADAQLTGWSSFDTLAVDFSEYNNNPLDPTSGLLEIREPKEYSNNYIFRVGGQYQMSDCFALRGGILYDFQPSPDKYVEAGLPDADDWGFSFGFGYNVTDQLVLDFSYMYLLYPERVVNNSAISTENPLDPGFFNGKYEISAHMVGLDLSYSF